MHDLKNQRTLIISAGDMDQHRLSLHTFGQTFRLKANINQFLPGNSGSDAIFGHVN